MTAVNGIIGANDTIIEEPITTLEENDLQNEKAMAVFAKSKEFKRLKAHLEDRIHFYQTCLPDGTPIAAANPTPNDWKIANVIITELRAILMAYENAREVIDERFR